MGAGLGLRLVVAFGIGNSFLAVATVCKCKCEVAHVPLVVGVLFQEFDVHVGNGHGETIVESYAAECVWDTEAWHAGDVFGNCYAVRVQLMKHLVGESQVRDTFGIYRRAEVFMVSS